jgi:hypothetical protein
MIILFWCPGCRALYGPSDVASTDVAQATMANPRCRRCNRPVEFRGIPDDPDDPQYGLPRCPTCRGQIRASSRFCTQCGTSLHTGPLPTLPGSPTQDQEALPSFADRVLAAVVAECQQILQSLQGDAILPSTGRPPTQCMIVEKTTSGGRLEWLYNLATNRLAPYAIGILDMSSEPVDGMYFTRGLIQYQLKDDGQALEFSCTLGPRFGRGLRFELVDAPEGVQLTQPAPLWIS